jgi:hypothetical protein
MAKDTTKPVKIGSDLHKQIEDEAKAKKRTMRAHVEDILERYIARKKGPK